MHGNNTSTSPSAAGQGTPSDQRRQPKFAAASSRSSSSSVAECTGRNQRDHGADSNSQKPATSNSAPEATSLVAESPSSSASMLNCFTSEGTTDTEDPDPSLSWTSSTEPPAVDESSSRPLFSSSPTSTSPGLPPPQETASTPACCLHPRCSKPAKYGPQDEQPIACQAHKRAGQYRVNRHGELLIATRDGEAFRTPTVEAPATVCSPVTCEVATAAPGRSKRRSTDGGSSSAPISSHRKKAAKLSPAPVQTLNGANRPAVISGEEGSPASQNRSCLFPGCNARPQYGLLEAVRAVYCFSHKKGLMVQVSTGAPAIQSHGENEISTAPPAVESSKTKKAPTPTAASEKNKAKKALRGPVSEGEGDGGAAGRIGDQVKYEGEQRKVAEGAAMEGSATPEAAATTLALTATADGEEDPIAVPAKDALPPPPSATRLADTSEMSPSAEIMILRQAREAAKKEAEASGGGRRPRAPSRRALEASGRMKGEGAQWMTREKKAEDARVKKELREQRRQYRAAGLNVGVVIEAFVAPGTGGLGGGGDVGGGGGGGRGTGEVHDKPSWQKVLPALLVARPPLPPMEEIGVVGESGGAS